LKLKQLNDCVLQLLTSITSYNQFQSVISTMNIPDKMHKANFDVLYYA